MDIRRRNENKGRFFQDRNRTESQDFFHGNNQALFVRNYRPQYRGHNKVRVEQSPKSEEKMAMS